MLDRQATQLWRLFRPKTCVHENHTPDNLIGRQVFNATRQTKKTSLRRLKNMYTFTPAVLRIGVHTHIGTRC